MPRACCARTHPAAHAGSCIAYSMCKSWAEDMQAELHQTRKESIPGIDLTMKRSSEPSTGSHSTFDFSYWPCLQCCIELIHLINMFIQLNHEYGLFCCPTQQRDLRAKFCNAHTQRVLRALLSNVGFFGEGFWQGGNLYPAKFSGHGWCGSSRTRHIPC